MNKVPSLRLIAEKVGVSHVTVSRALRGDRYVNEQTRDKILKVAEHLGYAPNPLYSALLKQNRSGNRNQFVGSLAWLDTDPIANNWPKAVNLRGYWNGAKNKAAQLGFSLETTRFPSKGMSSKRFESILKARNIRGILIPPDTETINLPKIDWAQYAVVSISSQESDGMRWDRVLPNHEQNMRLAFNALKAKGYSRIGLALTQLLNRTNEERWLSMYCFFQYNLPKQNQVPPLIMNGHLHEAWDEVQAWFNQYKPDAILCFAKEFKLTFEEIGYQVPRDLGLAHMQIPDVPVAWSGIDILRETLASAAVEVVTSKIQQNNFGLPTQRKTILIDGKWVEGKTA